MTGISNGVAPSILNASYTFTAEVTVPEGGGDGMIITQGGRFAGYGFYINKGKPTFDLEPGGAEGARPGKPRRRCRPASTRSSSTSSMTASGIGTLAFNDFSGIGKAGHRRRCR